MIVVDVGCATQGNEESIHALCDRFHPRTFYGFDPLVVEGTWRSYQGTKVVLYKAAAWLYDGTVQMHLNGDHTGVTHDEATGVECIDFQGFLWHHTQHDDVILKLDCEGAEYPLLWAIYHSGLDRHLSLLLVEWHEGVRRHGDFPSYGWHIMGRPPLRCEVESWS